MANIPSKHSRVTRLLHMALALLVIGQLTSSQLMETVKKGEENPYFEYHEYAGVTAFVIVWSFWFYIMMRREGTSLATLFPWFSSEGRLALRESARKHWAAMKQFQLTDHDPNDALPSAIHGLGMMLMAWMATTGAIFFIAIKMGESKSVWAKAVKELHEEFGTFVWIYLIGHAGIALINHFKMKQRLGEIWSLGRSDHS